MGGAMTTEAQVEAVSMPAAQLVEVEVKRWHGAGDGRVFGWQLMPVKEALRLQEDTFRCPECLGRVRLRPASAEKEKEESWVQPGRTLYRRKAPPSQASELKLETNSSFHVRQFAA